MGTKRSLVTDGNGIPIACIAAGANMNDFKLLAETLSQLLVEAPTTGKGLCLDKGYDYREIYELLDSTDWLSHIRSRGEEITGKKEGVRPRRWVVERTHSWMNCFRDILIRWCKKVENYTAQLHLVCSYIILCQSGLLG